MHETESLPFAGALYTVVIQNRGPGNKQEMCRELYSC